MAEAILSRSGGGGESETIVPITPGYHTILATLKTEDGVAITNQVVSCNDGGRFHNYTTNEKGQAMFVTNSGSANFLISRIINGVTYADIVDTWINIDAPVGLSSRANLVHNKAQNFKMESSGKFYTICNRNVNLHIVGGGGGGSGGFCNRRQIWAGGGGGAGYANNYNTKLNKGMYDFVAGSGGGGGASFDRSEKYAYNPQNVTNGGAGGTSYIKNTDFTAVGGQGGMHAYSSGPVAKGGLGDGNGGSSPVSYAGGGGGAGGGYNAPNPFGYPGGGAGSWTYPSGQTRTYVGANSGKLAGGGGGDACAGGAFGTTSGGGSGGTGVLYIEFL